MPWWWLSPDQLMKAFERHLEEIEEWLGERANYEVLYVSYNDLMKDPAAAVEAVNRFLGGALDGDAMLKTVDPSLYRQRC